MNAANKEIAPVTISSPTDWVVRHQRFGNDAAIAILSHDQRGMRVVAALKYGPDLKDIKENHPEFGLIDWTELNNPNASTVTNTKYAVLYGGPGSFEITPMDILTASIEPSDGGKRLKEINSSLRYLAENAQRFLKTLRSLHTAS